MFEKITEKISSSFKKLRGNSVISESNIEDSLKEIRLSLLEADVNYKVVKELIDNIKEKSIGAEVLNSISPAEQFIKIFNDELTQLLGNEANDLNIKVKPPAVILIIGLQGSGKTTTSAKLAKYLKDKMKRNPTLVSVDIYRPAAIKQLEVLSNQGKINFIPHEDNQEVTSICKNAKEFAYNSGSDTLIIDTAGRLQIDDDMLVELKDIKKSIEVNETLLVVDSMIGQEALNVADTFNKEIGIDGLIMTKLDGDARGGAALSAKYITNKSIKFYGSGEGLDMIEVFHPERMASRILGMGDVVSLVEKASESVSEDDAKKLTKKLKNNDFTLNDFKTAISSMNKIGSLKSTISMIPGMGKLSQDEGAMQKANDELKKTVAIINSMTPNEREDHTILDGSRRRRIASGSGTAVQDINILIKKFLQMKKMSKNMDKFKKKSKNMLNFS